MAKAGKWSWVAIAVVVLLILWVTSSKAGAGAGGRATYNRQDPPYTSPYEGVYGIDWY